MSPTAMTLLRGTPLKTIETCHSSWEFDEERHLFRRTLRHGAVAGVSTPWRRYERLLVDASGNAFVVLLERSRTRVLVGRRCERGCRCRTAVPPPPALPTEVSAPLGQSRVCALGPVGEGRAEARIIPFRLLPDAAPRVAPLIPIPLSGAGPAGE